MNINFDEKRFKAVHDTYRKWWNHELDRPVLNITLYGSPSDMEKPEGYAEVEFSGLEVSVYVSNGQPQVAAKATGISLVKKA